MRQGGRREPARLHREERSHQRGQAVDEWKLVEQYGRATGWGTSSGWRAIPVGESCPSASTTIAMADRRNTRRPRRFVGEQQAEGVQHHTTVNVHIHPACNPRPLSRPGWNAWRVTRLIHANPSAIAPASSASAVAREPTAEQSSCNGEGQDRHAVTVSHPVEDHPAPDRIVEDSRTREQAHHDTGTRVAARVSSAASGRRRRIQASAATSSDQTAKPTRARAPAPRRG